MAEPLDAAIFLEDVSEIFQTQYMDDFPDEFPSRFGSITNKLIKPYKEIAATDGITMQFKYGHADSVRTDTNPLGDMAAPQAAKYGSMRLRFNRQTPSSNDFTYFSASCQFDIYTIENMMKGTIVDAVKDVYDQIIPDYNEKLANLRNAPRTGQLALVQGSPKENDARLMADATATADNTDGIRINIDNGSIASFRNNVRVDFINPSTGAVNAGNIRITDTNTALDEVGGEFISTGPTGGLSTGDLANVADNDIIVYSGTYNKGYYGFAAWFTEPATSGDSFIGGVDRAAKTYRFLYPTSTRENDASERINASHFDDLAIAMGYLSEDPQAGLSFMTTPKLHTALRRELGEDSFREIPLDDSRMERFMNFGSIGLNYQHPTFGLVKILADPLMSPNTLRAIAANTWKAVFVNHRGLKKVTEGGNHWYRMQQSTPNSGKGLIMKADWFGNQVDFCLQPWKNGQIKNISAT
jgi:hypothetical protein